MFVSGGGNLVVLC